MRRKLRAKLLLLLMLPVLLTGCWDRRELEELAFVLMLGVDKGTQDRFNVTAAIAVPSKMAGGGKNGGGGAGAEPPYLLTSVEGPTVLGALSLISGYVDRQLSLDHTMAVFMGEDLAKEGALQAMDTLVRFRESRRTTIFVVTKGKAAEFLEHIKPELETNPQRYLEKITSNYRRTGLLPAHGQVQSFIAKVNTKYRSPLTFYAALKEEENKESRTDRTSKSPFSVVAGELPRTGGPNVEVMGSAAFKGDKMVGVLSGEETRLGLMLSNRFERGIFSIPDPRHPAQEITLDVRRSRPTQINADLSGSRPRIRGRIRLEGHVVSMPVANDYTEPELQAELEEAFSAFLEQQVAELIKKTQEWETDIFGFGYVAARHFATMQDWENYDWPEQYPEADIDFSVEMTLRRFGLQLSPPTSHRERRE